MDLKAEKRTGAVLAAVTLLIVILLPLVFRELEPDYDAAYSLDPSRKRRFAEKGAKAPELPNLPPSAASASASVEAARVPRLDVSAHKALPSMGRVSAETPPPAAAPGTEPPEAPAPATTTGAALTAGARSGGGAPARTPRLRVAETSPFSPQDGSTPRPAAAGAGTAEAARLAKSMGFGDVPALLEAGKEAKSNRCAEAAGRLKPRLNAATVAYKAAAAELEGSGCSKDSCGLYGDDCAQKERSAEEARVAARRCRCDKLACRRIETCRVVDELTCQQETACGVDASRCSTRCL